MKIPLIVVIIAYLVVVIELALGGLFGWVVYRRIKGKENS